jgi:uncharacterized protein DUF4864
MVAGHREIKSMRLAIAVVAIALVVSADTVASAVDARTTHADEPDADVRDATLVVMRQLEAFRRGDFEAAYGFASESIRAQFDRQSFEQMVKNGYPEIARSLGAYVTETHVGPDGTLYLVLRIRGANGVSIDAIYEMVREGGDFRINGVVTRPAGASAATHVSRIASSRSDSIAPPKRACS